MFDKSRIAKLVKKHYVPNTRDDSFRYNASRSAVHSACHQFRLYPNTTTERALQELSRQDVTASFDKLDGELRIHTHDRSLGDYMKALADHLLIQQRYVAFVNYSFLANVYTLVVQHRTFTLQTVAH